MAEAASGGCLLDFAVGEAFKVVANGVDADELGNIWITKVEGVETPIIWLKLDGMAGGGMDLEKFAAIQTVVGDVMLTCKVEEGEDVGEAIFVEVDGGGAEVALMGGGGGTRIAVDCDGSVGRADVLEVGGIDILVNGALAVKEEFMRADSTVTGLLREAACIVGVFVEEPVVDGR